MSFNSTSKTEMPGRGQRQDRLRGWLGSQQFFILCTLLPAGIFLVMLTLYPFLTNIWYSLLKYDLVSSSPPAFIGLENYIDVLKDREFLEALMRTLYYVTVAVGTELVLGLLIALLLSQNLPGEGIFRGLLVLPLAATPVAVGLIWRLMYNPTGGLANHMLESIGLPGLSWVSSTQGVLPSLILIDVWQWTPFVVLILLAGLLALPEEPFEAAKIDGASSLQTFWYLTLPMLSPMISVAALFRVIDSLKVFDSIWVVTGGGPGHASTTLNIYAFRMGFEFLHMGKAATIATLMLVLAITISNILLKFSAQKN